MGTLRTKLVRDMRRSRAQFVGIIITIALGTALFGGSYDAYRGLKASYAELYERLAFGDLWMTGGDIGGFARSARAVEGVDAVTTRSEAEIAMRVGDDHRLLAGVIGLPANGEPEVNRVVVLEGSLLPATATDAVLVDQHVAHHFEIHPGQSIDLRSDDEWRPFRVAGIVASPEYIWAARNRQDVLTSPEAFGVVFASDSSVRDMADGALRRAIARYTPGSSRATLDRELRKLASRHGAVDVFSRAEQPSNHALQSDVAGFRQMAVLFPLLFLAAAGLGTWVLLGRLVGSQRATIGMLLANGVRRRTVFAHYLGFGLIAAIAGVVPGIPVGFVLARAVAGTYTSQVGVPLTIVPIGAETPIVSVGFAVAVGLAAAVLPARRAMRLAPAEAMRGVGPTGVGRVSVVERILPAARRLPTPTRLVLRNVERAPRRAIASATGAVAASVLILTSWGMIDTATVLVHRQFDEIQLDDARVTLAQPLTAVDLERLREVEGVAAAEPFGTVPVGLEAHGNHYGTSVLAFEHGTTMHRFGGDAGLPEVGLLLGAAAREELGIDTGDEVVVHVPSTGVTTTERVAGFVDEPLGTYAYTSLPHLSSLTSLVGGGSTETSGPSAGAALLRYDRGVDRDEMRRRLSGLEGVVVVTDSHALLEVVNEFLGLFFAIVGAMLVFGAVLAFVLLYNTMSMNVADRSVEMATLRASGVAHGRLARLVSAENLLVTAIALGPGLVAGYLTSRAFMQSFSNDQFNFALTMRPTTPVLAAIGVLLVALASQVPSLRRLRRLDLAAIMHERSV